MIEDPLTQLLEGRFPDPDSGGTLAAPDSAVVIDSSLADAAADLVGGLELGRRFLVVSDANTERALGADVARALASLGTVERHVFDAPPHPDMDTARAVERAGPGCDALVAVGSGTINDLVKHAAAALDRPYVVFGTAPSMNGYTSANAAITEHGHKKSLACRTPAGAFLDLDVLCQSPTRLIRAGLGDSVCRSTAQTDWLLASTLRDEPYQEAPFALLAHDEPGLLAEPEALVAGDREAMRRLARTLVLSGFGMTLCGSSRPASQGEHLISHYIDMMSSPDRDHYLHGEQVAVSTLTVADLQHAMLDGPRPRVSASTTTRGDIIAHFGDETGAECWSEFAGKRLDAEAADAMNGRIEARWDDLRESISRVARTPATLRAALRDAGAPMEHTAIGCSDAFYRDAVLHARELRNRYTFLDLGAETGVLSAALPAVRA